MLPVYICEDEAPIRRRFREEMEKHILIHGYDMEVVLCTSDPAEVIAGAKEAQCRGIYFLDVDLQHDTLDGFKLGQEIRKYDSRGFLIYVTAFSDLAFETFRYHLEALDYIVKDEGGAMLGGIRSCLDTIMGRMFEEEKGEDKEFFTVKAADSVRHIPLAEVLCFATSERTHRIVLYTGYECLDFIGRLNEIEQQLGERFIRTHRAFLVNRDKIREFDIKQNEITLVNGQKCLVSRKMKAAVKDIIDAG